MATTNNNSESNIINRMSFKNFFIKFGKRLRLADFVNKETGESFSMLAFGTSANPKELTYVGFSQNLGELTSAEINREKDNLQIIQLRVNPEVLARRKAEGRQLESYKVCRVGEMSWEEVELDWDV
jgi:hypothetical protein